MDSKRKVLTDLANDANVPVTPAPSKRYRNNDPNLIPDEIECKVIHHKLLSY